MHCPHSSWYEWTTTTQSYWVRVMVLEVRKAPDSSCRVVFKQCKNNSRSNLLQIQLLVYKVVLVPPPTHAERTYLTSMMTSSGTQSDMSQWLRLYPSVTKNTLSVMSHHQATRNNIHNSSRMPSIEMHYFDRRLLQDRI